jgi:phosphoribosyl-ATP pyrophosphohydrolase
MRDKSADTSDPLSTDSTAYGYHLKPILKGELGEISKIQEELSELVDAHEQGARIMELCELSDLIGAVKAYLSKHHPGTSIEDVLLMSEITERAFRSGRRT